MINTILFQKRENNGYIEIKVENRWVKEHRYVIEKFINRGLNKNEVIHHLDEIRSNNLIQNLMLFPTEQEHQSFHLKIKQFGYTQPILNQIKNRWKEFGVENE